MNTFDKIQKAIGISYKNKKHYHHDHIDGYYRYALSHPIDHEWIGESGVFGVDKWRKRGEKKESSVTITFYIKDENGDIIDNNYITLENDRTFTYDLFRALLRIPDPQNLRFDN